MQEIKAVANKLWVYRLEYLFPCLYSYILGECCLVLLKKCPKFERLAVSVAGTELLGGRRYQNNFALFLCSRPVSLRAATCFTRRHFWGTGQGQVGHIQYINMMYSQGGSGTVSPAPATCVLAGGRKRGWRNATEEGICCCYRVHHDKLLMRLSDWTSNLFNSSTMCRSS
jgi:hypothetical protein